MLTKFIIMALAAAFASASDAPGSVDQDGSGNIYSYESFPGTTVPPTPLVHFSPHSTISAHAAPTAVPACAPFPFPIGMNVDGIGNEEFVIVRRDALKRDGSLVALEPTVVTGADGINTTLYNTLPYGSPPTVTNTQTIYLSSASPTISADSVTSNTESQPTATPGVSSSETAGASQTFVTASHSDTSTDTATSTNTVTSSIPGTLTETTVTGSDTQTVVTSDTTSPSTSTVETTTAVTPTASTDTTVSVTEITSIPTGDTTTPSTLVTATGTPSSETTTPLTTQSTGHPSSTTSRGQPSTSSTVAPSSTPSSNGVRAAKAGGAMLFGLGGVVALVG